MLAVTGAAAHAAPRGRSDAAYGNSKGADFALDLGQWINILMPITEIVYGSRRLCLKDLPRYWGILNLRL